MTEENEVERIAAILGFVLKEIGEDVLISSDSITAGLPPGCGVHVEFDDKRDVLVVGIREVASAE